MPSERAVDSVGNESHSILRTLNTNFQKTLEKRCGVEIEGSGNDLAVERPTAQRAHPLQEGPLPKRRLVVELSVHVIGPGIVSVFRSIRISGKSDCSSHT